MNSERISWIDVAKAVGIFAIYLGHFGESAGLAYRFVFRFHVPLFFFISGCLETRNQRGILPNLYHKFITIIIPFWVFGISSIIFNTLLQDSHEMIKPNILLFIKGAIRNNFLAAGLWFLTCLFIIEIIFFVIKQIPNKIIIFLICLAIHWGATYLIKPCPATEPHWYYNLDSALYYLIFYALGYLLYNHINNALTSTKWYVNLSVIFLGGGLTFFYATYMFFGKDLLAELWGYNKVLRFSANIFIPLIMIWCVIVFSYIFRECTCFQNIGKNTLYLCGSEYLIKITFPILVSIFGLNINLDNPVAAYIYTLILLVVANYSIVPVLKYLVDRIQGLFRRLNQSKIT